MKEEDRGRGKKNTYGGKKLKEKMTSTANLGKDIEVQLWVSHIFESLDIYTESRWFEVSAQPLEFLSNVLKWRKKSIKEQ